MLSQLYLGFPVLGQVEGCNLLRLLNLALVGPELVVELVHQVLHLHSLLPLLLALQ